MQQEALKVIRKVTEWTISKIHLINLDNTKKKY